MEDANGDEHAERCQNQDGRRRDRCVEVTALELRVHDERQRLRPALDVAGEHDRGAELAKCARPAHDRPGRQGRTGECSRDPAEHVALGGAIDAGGVLDVPVHARDARPGGTDEERGRDEGLGEDHGHGREWDGDPGDLQRTADQSFPAEDEQQRQPGHGRWQHDRQVHRRLDQ